MFYLFIILYTNNNPGHGKDFVIVVWDDWYVDGIGFVQCMAIHIPIVSNDDQQRLFIFMFYLLIILYTNNNPGRGKEIIIVVWDDWYVDGLGFVQCMAIHIPIVSKDDKQLYLYIIFVCY